MVGIYIIMWHVGILGLQLFVFATLDNGIHKEAAGITCHLGVRKLGIADVDDHLAQLGGSGHLNATAVQFATDIAIFGRLMTFISRQLIDNMRNEVFVLPLMLETAVTITILTLLAREDAQLASTYLYSLDRCYQILHLCTISTDILYGTGTYLTRNKREVFSTIESMAYAPGNDLVPRLTTTATNTAIRPWRGP